jgi:hypothetical protein
MSYSTPKGRNYSKENLQDKKYYGVRHSEKATFFSLLTSGNILQEKTSNKPLMYFLSNIVAAKAKMSSPNAHSPTKILNLSAASCSQTPNTPSSTGRSRTFLTRMISTTNPSRNHPNQA